MSTSRRSSIFWLGLVLVAALGALLLGTSLRNGIGITPDSLSYLAMAEAVRQGGLPQLVQTGTSHYPPFYSILLALLGAIRRQLPCGSTQCCSASRSGSQG